MEALANLNQDLVTSMMAGGVVDFLEAVEIDKDHRCRFTAGQRLLQTLLEQRSVRELSKVVIVSELIQPLLLLLSFRDVPEKHAELTPACLFPAGERYFNRELNAVAPQAHKLDRTTGPLEC